MRYSTCVLYLVQYGRYRVQRKGQKQKGRLKTTGQDAAAGGEPWPQRAECHDARRLPTAPELHRQPGLEERASFSLLVF